MAREIEYVSKDVLIEWLRPYLHTGEPIPADVLISDIRMMSPTLTPPNEPLTLEQLRGMANKPFPGGKRGRPKKRTNEERLKQMGTQELARELSLIAMWDRKQLKKAQENPGLEAFMGKWLREPAEDN